MVYAAKRYDSYVSHKYAKSFPKVCYSNMPKESKEIEAIHGRSTSRADRGTENQNVIPTENDPFA
jgi:hypothetical protein